MKNQTSVLLSSVPAAAAPAPSVPPRILEIEPNTRAAGAAVLNEYRRRVELAERRVADLEGQVNRLKRLLEPKAVAFDLGGAVASDLDRAAFLRRVGVAVDLGQWFAPAALAELFPAWTVDEIRRRLLEAAGARFGYGDAAVVALAFTRPAPGEILFAVVLVPPLDVAA